jgi:DNA-binding HxlR family transcriptional regulator
METNDPMAAADAMCETLDASEDRLVREILDHVADKWSLWVIHVLGTGGRLRFSRVLEKVEGISQKMLTKTLRQLERDGIVSRTMYLEVPPRVEYELTPLGRELLLRVLPLWTWIGENVDAFRAARGRFDARSPDGEGSPRGHGGHQEAIK